MEVLGTDLLLFTWYRSLFNPIIIIISNLNMIMNHDLDMDINQILNEHGCKSDDIHDTFIHGSK